MKIPLVPSKRTRAAALLVECAEIGENQVGESVCGVRLRHDRTCPPTRPRSGETDGPLQDPRDFRTRFPARTHQRPRTREVGSCPHEVRPSTLLSPLNSGTMPHNSHQLGLSSSTCHFQVNSNQFCGSAINPPKRRNPVQLLKSAVQVEGRENELPRTTREANGDTTRWRCKR